MTVWNKIVLGCKFMFGGFESATDYLLQLLNTFLAKGDTPERVQKARAYVITILAYLRKYQDFCPMVWLTHYEKLLSAVESLVDVLEDNKVSAEELAKVVSSVQAAIEEWFKD
jgi:hypothetical protein